MKQRSGYWHLTVGGRPLLKHRVLYAMHHRIELGSLPYRLDHVDRDCANNRIDNLRPATPSENGYNSGLNSANTSGFKGVNWHKQNKKWVAKLKVDGRHIHVGYFSTPEQASIAREKAANDLHGAFAHHAVAQ